MILADTSIWIEFFRAHAPIAPVMQAELEQQRIVAVECVFGELLQGAKTPRERTLILDYWRNIPKRDETDLWIDAGTLSAREQYSSRGIGLIDAFLIAFAKRHRVHIWSLDKKLLAALEPHTVFDLPRATR